MVVLVVAGVTASFGPAFFGSSEERTVWSAAEALSRRDFGKAESLAASVPETSPLFPVAAVIAGESCAALHEHDQAIRYFRKATEGPSEVAIAAHAGLGERYLMIGDLGRAEEHFLKVIDRNPYHFLANKRLSHLFQVQGRSLESIPYALRMIQMGLFGATEIHIAGCAENRFLEDNRLLALCQDNFPDDYRPRLANARLLQLKNQTNEARAAYLEIVERHADVIEPYARLARISLDQGDVSRFLEINQHLPDSADQNATTWVNRGIWALQHQQPEVAAGCFYRAMDLIPHHAEANYLMSQALVRLGRSELADKIGKRAQLLSRIELTVPEFYGDPAPSRMRDLIADFEAVGRYWEAAAVADFAVRSSFVPPVWAKADLKKFSRKLQESGSVLFPKDILNDLHEFAKADLPDWSSLASDEPDDMESKTNAAIRFRNIASPVGLNFTYFNGSLSNRGMEHIFETTGGGTVAFDYDLDSWPDLYFTQGAPIWEGDDDVLKPDALFANRTGRAVLVTDPAGLGDTGFGQGATSGDIQNDGFPDLYVCNLYGNRFYENNGDGTFSEITDQTKTAGDQWSLSSVIVDLNRDSLPDLYVVNYLKRDAVFNQRCKRNGEPLTCAPTMFPAEQDRLYVNKGDGTFEEMTQTSGIVQPDGKGLAILAGDLDDSRRISLYIGNDTTADFFLKNQTDLGGKPVFREAGLISGLALDGAGRSLATMGIAAGDIDRSGSLDLFVTDFYETSNVLYLQEAPGQFVDSTKRAGLYEPSIPLLGFGTEFVDADLDGELDLFVTNGHVDRTFATGEPDEMPPQFYRGRPGVRFELLSSGRLGTYFEGKYLGRSVSRLDWNRDGRDDLSVLHLYTPVGLLVNESDVAGHFLKLFLKGRTVDRDAIGTKVTVYAGDDVWHHQLVAGDGYMTTNERQITVGLGDHAQADRVLIQWMDGTTTELFNLQGDSTFLIDQSELQPRFLW